MFRKLSVISKRRTRNSRFINELIDSIYKESRKLEGSNSRNNVKPISRLRSRGKIDVKKLKQIKTILENINSENAKRLNQNQFQDLENLNQEIDETNNVLNNQDQLSQDANDSPNTEIKPFRFSDEENTNQEKANPELNITKSSIYDRGNVFLNPFETNLKDIYNLALADRTKRWEFKQRFKAIQFGNRNATAQAQGLTSHPDFQTAERGVFLAVFQATQKNYLVIPQFDISIDETAYNEGGFSLVFDCIGYQKGISFNKFQIVKPAIFTNEKDHWILLQIGALKLLS